MCTLSWKPTDSGYVLRFNRDEQRSRKPALAPTHKQRNNVNFLAPTDAEKGGAWMLVNAHGLSICLLNHYPETPPPKIDKIKSRGNLVLGLADCTNVSDVIHRCKSMSLESYPSFQLVAIDVRGAAQLTWNGRSYTTSSLNKNGAMLSSSSFRPKAIICSRHKIFTRIVGDISKASDEQLDAFHSQRDADSAASVRMSRPDACTHNISRIEIFEHSAEHHSENYSETKTVAKFYYEPQAEISPTEQAMNISMTLSSPEPVFEPSL